MSARFPIVITAVNQTETAFKTVEKGAGRLDSVFKTVNKAVVQVEKSFESLLGTIEKTSEFIITLPVHVKNLALAFAGLVGKVFLASQIIVASVPGMLSLVGSSKLLSSSIIGVGNAAAWTSNKMSQLTKTTLGYAGSISKAALFNKAFISSATRVAFILTKWTLVLGVVIAAVTLLVNFFGKLIDRLKKTDEVRNFATAWSNLAAVFNQLIDSMAEFVVESEVLQTAFAGLGELVKNLAISISWLNLQLQKAISFGKLLKEAVSGNLGLGDLRLFFNELNAANREFDETLKDIVFNIRIAKNETSDWVPILQRVADSFKSDQRSTLLEFLTLFKSRATREGFIEFLSILGQSNDKVNELTSTFGSFFMSISNDLRASGLDDSALIKFLADPSSLNEFEFQKVAEIFDALEGRLSNSQFLLMSESIDKFRESLKETLPVVFDWQAAIAEGFDESSASFSSFSDLFQNNAQDIMSITSDMILQRNVDARSIIAFVLRAASAELLGMSAKKAAVAAEAKIRGGLASTKALEAGALATFAAASGNLPGAALYTAAAGQLAATAAAYGATAAAATASAVGFGAAGIAAGIGSAVIGGGATGTEASGFAGGSGTQRERELAGGNSIAATAGRRTINVNIEIQGNVINNDQLIDDLALGLKRRLGDGLDVGFV